MPIGNPALGTTVKMNAGRKSIPIPLGLPERFNEALKRNKQGPDDIDAIKVTSKTARKVLAGEGYFRASMITAIQDYIKRTEISTHGNNQSG